MYVAEMKDDYTLFDAFNFLGITLWVGGILCPLVLRAKLFSRNTMAISAHHECRRRHHFFCSRSS